MTTDLRILLMILAISPGFSACYQGIDLGESELREEPGPSDMQIDSTSTQDDGAVDAGDMGDMGDMGEALPDLGPTFSATSIAVGENASCAINPEGELWCWGANMFGLLGTTEPTQSFTPQRISTDTHWAQVNVADDHACARRTDGSLWCWGANTEGQLARDPVMVPESTEPLEIPIGPVAVFDSKNDHVCAVTTDERLFCWGDNSEAQVGQGTNEFSGAAFYDLPKEVIEPGPWSAVSVGDAHSCGLKVDGSIWCWGRNTQFAASNEETSQVLQPAKQAMPSARTWQEVSVGVYHSCGRASDGEWLCWGTNRSGQIRFPSSDPIAGIVPIDRTGLTEISTNGFSACGLDSEQALWCWGLNIDGHIVGVDQVHIIVEPTMTSEGLGPIREVSVGRFHVCALDAESRIWCAGSNNHGQLGSAENHKDISTRWLPVLLP